MKVKCFKCGNIFDFSKFKYKAHDKIYGEPQYYYCDDCVDKYVDNIFENYVIRSDDMIDKFVNAMQEDNIEAERIC